MARILVTGSNGFLGRHLCKKLEEGGNEIVTCDNLLGSEHIGGLGTDYVDSCRAEKWHNLKNIDIAYLLAATPHEGLSVFSPATVCKHTYLSAVAATVAAINAGCKRIVFCSSMARYGIGWKEGPFKEDFPPAPVDPYGIAKLAAEQTLFCLGQAHGVEVVVIVPHNIYGPGQRYYDPFRNVVGIMINLMLQNRPVIIYGDGEQKRCFSYVDDCVEPMVTAGFKEGLDGEVINVGPDDPEEFITINRLASLLWNIIDPKMVTCPGVRHVPDRPCEVKLSWCSGEKARRLLGYECKTPLVEGLRKMVDWVREQGPRKFEYHLPIEIDSDKLPVTWKERMF